MFAFLGTFAAALLLAPQDAAPPAAELALWRLDCGTLNGQALAFYDDSLGHEGETATFAASCYLIRHGDDYLLWDAGVSTEFLRADPAANAEHVTLGRSIREQLAEIGVSPAQVTRVAISHYHWDHSGQLAEFPDATLVIGAEDWAAVRGGAPALGLQAALFDHWTSGGGQVRTVRGDADLFGDGSVRMLALPGHTPGHHGLLVRLREAGPVLLSGDLAHFTENYAEEGVPIFNTDRADTLASFDRFKKIAANLDATVIVQHEAADIAKLPAFPASAR